MILLEALITPYIWQTQFVFIVVLAFNPLMNRYDPNDSAIIGRARVVAQDFVSNSSAGAGITRTEQWTRDLHLTPARPY